MVYLSNKATCSEYDTEGGRRFTTDYCQSTT